MGNVLRLAALALSLCPLGSATLLFSNLAGSGFSGYGPGGATDPALGTAVGAQKFTFDSGFEGGFFQAMTFGVWNTVGDMSARPGFRFWLPDGASGAPGTFVAGFSLDPIDFAPGITFHTEDIAPFHVPIPQNDTYWVGVLFDGVGTTATASQLNFLALPLYGPPTVGSAEGQLFWVSDPGSTANNPPGAFDLDIAPNAFAMEFSVPEPGTASMLGSAAIALICLARRKKRA